jgi:hypothetical protein
MTAADCARAEGQCQGLPPAITNAAAFEHAIAEALASAPPLTPEQCRRLTSLLTGGGAHG